MCAAEKRVLVTGASSGIGRDCVELLSQRGFHVYAGARKDADIAELERMEHVTAVRLDVERQDDVERLASLIRESGTGLYAVVNNAGVGYGGPIMDVTESELQGQFSVNLLGVHRVTRAVFPFIVESKGRVVMMSSYNGKIATPFMGPYCMSKFGLEGYSDSFRREMLPYGIKVIVVEPGAYKTKIWDKGLDYLEKHRNMKYSIEELGNICLDVMERSIRENKDGGDDPIKVARVVLEALTSKNPKRRYPVMKGVHKFKFACMFGEGMVDGLVLKEFKKIKDKTG